MEFTLGAFFGVAFAIGISGIINDWKELVIIAGVVCGGCLYSLILI